MARTFIGHDSTGTACLKVTLDSADDPYSTPDADRHKFAYNSKDHKVAEIAGIKPEILTNTGGAWVNAGDGLWHRGQYFNPDQFTYWTSYSAAAFPDLDYACPLVDYKYRDSAGKGVDLQFVSTPSGSFGGYVMIGARPKYLLYGTQNPGGTSIGGNDQSYTPTTGYSYTTGGYPSDTIVGFYREQIFNQVDIHPFGSGSAIVWNLPGDNTPLLQAPPETPVPGHKSIEITPTSMKIAKPGYDVATATKQQLAYSAEKRPVKVIASGDILLAATATTTYDIGFTVDATVYLDVLYYADGGEIYYPADPSINYYGAKYYVSGSTIYFENAGVACRARFIVIAVDALGPSSGSNKVFRQFEEGGEQVVQLLAPGSADPPKLSDIIMDSRWPTMPILAEGYIPVTLFAPHSFTINFDNPGFQPFVKMSIVRNYAGGQIATQPTVRRLIRNGFSNNMGGDSVHARLASSGTQIVINTFPLNPSNFFVSGGFEYTWVLPQVVGVRYYVFGIPT